MESVRVRRRNSLFMKKLEGFDAFPKLDRNASLRTQSGGFATLIISIIIVYLTISELVQYFTIQQKFEFLVDHSRSHDHNLQINFDISVNMLCSGKQLEFNEVYFIQDLRVDVLDSSGDRIKLSESQFSKIPVFCMISTINDRPHGHPKDQSLLGTNYE